KKIDVENWNRPLVWTAWVLFVISFFLPSFGTGGGWLWGWQCAWVSLTAWGGTGLDYSVNTHLALLTLANLLMIASRFLLPHLSRNTHSRTWLRFFCWSASLLVWSFIIRSFAGGGKDLEIGCYVWAISFLLLALATVSNAGKRIRQSHCGSPHWSR
ncbi:MAG TPA: hypothetical protein VFM25_05065, partial [Verrucomicrobiae bacterium]|nr:hypothetical protein [Verrucomicrobiae bacterium]